MFLWVFDDYQSYYQRINTLKSIKMWGGCPIYTLPIGDEFVP